MKIYTERFLWDKVLSEDKQNFVNMLSHKDDWYEYFEIPKKDGKRKICAFSEESGKKVKELQARLLRRFLQKIPVAACAKGFIKGESYLSFLEPHMGKQYFMRLDIQNFFDSFSEDLIKKGLDEFVEDKGAAADIFELCTWNDALPQGAVTSPALSNIFFRRADQRIIKYCQTISERCTVREYARGDSSQTKRNVWDGNRLCYTRYADDMLFSSDFFDFRKEKNFTRMIGKILGDYGFKLNRCKTAASEGQIVLNGYVVGKTVRLSRKKLKMLKRILYFFRKDNSRRFTIDKNKVQTVCSSTEEVNRFLARTQSVRSDFKDSSDLIWYLAGCRSWIIAVLRIRMEDNRAGRDLDKLKKRIEELLKILDDCEKKEKKWADNG